MEKKGSCGGTPRVGKKGDLKPSRGAGVGRRTTGGNGRGTIGSGVGRGRNRR